MPYALTHDALFTLVGEDGPFIQYTPLNNNMAVTATYTVTEAYLRNKNTKNWPVGRTVNVDPVYTAWTSGTVTWQTEAVTTATTNYIYRAWCDVATNDDMVAAMEAAQNARFVAAVDRAAARQPMTEERRRQLAEEEARRRALYEEENRRNQALLAEQRAKSEIANTKAFALLLSALTEQQRADLLTKDYFFVTSQSGKLYRIDRGSHLNVRLIDPATRKVLTTYCAYTPGCPDGDSMLAQKLMLECMEEQFLKIANEHRNEPLPHQGVTREDFIRLAGVGPMAGAAPAHA